MNVREILGKLGYQTVGADWYNRIDSWAEWYKGKTTFHNYSVYNGAAMIGQIRKSLGMAKKLAEDKADLLLNEKVTISTDEETLQKYIDDVLDANNFWVAGNQLIEETAAFGTGAFVEYLSGGEIKIDYIAANCIYPISWLNGQITQCAFASVINAGGSDAKIYINIHIKEGGQYIVLNYLYKEASGEKIALPDGASERWETKSASPLFQIVKLNIANNIDPFCPMGMSVFGNCIDLLESIDLIYDSYYNEFKLGKKRIFINDSVVRIDTKTGKPVPIFDPNDTVFYGITGDGGVDAKKAIGESNMELRCADHQTGLQDQLDMLSEKAGFGRGYYKFNSDGVKTATEVISMNSQLFRKIKKDEIILDKVLTDMVRALLFLGGRDIKAEISIGFDDSIVDDVEAKSKRALLELAAGVIDGVIYHQRVYGLTEAAATQLVQEIASRAPIETGFGSGDGKGGGNADDGVENGEGVDDKAVIEQATQAAGKALSGTQTESLLNIVEKYVGGSLTIGQATNIIASAIGISKDEARALLEGTI